MTLCAELIPVLVAFFIVAVSPGPANIAVATVAMSGGRAPAMRFGAGLGFGLAFWGLVAATGMGAVLQGSALLLTVLKVMGGLYLFWLAYQSMKSARRPEADKQMQAGKDRWFTRGLLLNLSNPKAVVAWMAALSMGMGADDSVGQLFIATILCMALGFVNYFGHALAFSRAGFMAGYARFRRWIDGTVAMLFAGAGLGLLRSALQR